MTIFFTTMIISLITVILLFLLLSLLPPVSPPQLLLLKNISCKTNSHLILNSWKSNFDVEDKLVHVFGASHYYFFVHSSSFLSSFSDQPNLIECMSGPLLYILCCIMWLNELNYLVINCSLYCEWNHLNYLVIYCHVVWIKI